MHIQVDDVVVTVAVPVAAVFQVLYQRLEGSGAHDVYAGGKLAVLQGVHQGAGDGAVADIQFAAGPGGDEQDVEGRRCFDGRRGVDGFVVAPDDGFVHGERAILVGVVQAFPVQGVELRLADDFDGEGVVALFPVVGVEVGIGAE